MGDRWTLLIVRELLARGQSRYTDLRAGLPGIATNLLADRLRELETAGLVDRVAAPPPVATTVFQLTPRGEALGGVIRELGQWGVPLMTEYRPDDSFRGQWLRLPVRTFLADHEPGQPAASIQIRADDQVVMIDVGAGEVSLRLEADPHPDAVITGSPPSVLALFSGHLPLSSAEERGLHITGSTEAVARILPRSPYAGEAGGPV
ncbi:winged helix-turn-helix transcriptional regulator [Streptomyces sp. NPDC058122]|uniref:winged helix-turn-helix transcriptional regulator n=1 Tax=Streptomyces sp. NPDC058122 TaxID=3346349 RepID=UPI0036E3ADD0